MEDKLLAFATEVIGKFGCGGQLDILQEECAELIQASSKAKRGYGVDGLKEEMAHVIISIAVCSIIYGISAQDIIEQINTKAAKYGFKLIAM